MNDNVNFYCNKAQRKQVIPQRVPKAHVPWSVISSDIIIQILTTMTTLPDTQIWQNERSNSLNC